MFITAPALGQITVYRDQGAFADAVQSLFVFHIDKSYFLYCNPPPDEDACDYIDNIELPNPLTLNNTTISARALVGYDDVYSNQYIGAFGGVNFSSTTQALGFDLGAWSIGGDVGFEVGDQIGDVFVPSSGEGTSFIGFLSSSGPIEGSFTHFDELDLVKFYEAEPKGISAVPEPGTWGMLLIGFAAIGAVTRRRSRQETLALA